MILYPSAMEFRACTVRVCSGYVETVFREDGSVARADVPWGDNDHIASCWTAGYGGDQWRMVVEHEAAHAFLADELGLPHSWSVWAAAHGSGGKTADSLWPQRVRDEEHLVVSLQRYVNCGVRDSFDKLGQTFGACLPDVARRFATKVRPWLGEGYREGL